MLRIVGLAAVAAIVVVGVLAQTGAHLLAPARTATASGADESDLPFARPGPHAVGFGALDDASTPTTVWYPAVADGRPRASYTFAINVLSPDTAIAIATHDGVAGVGATPDRGSGPYPIVVLSHGFALTPGSYGWLGEHLASHGLVVVAPRHEEVLDPGTLWRSTVERPTLVGATIDAVAKAAGGGDLAGLVDLDRLAVVGHSYGGFTALAAAGARIDPTSFRALCEPAEAEGPIEFLCEALVPRLDQMAALAGLGPEPDSPWPSAGTPGVDAVVSMAGDAAMFTETGLADVVVPVLAIGGTADTDSPFEWSTRLTYDHVSSERKAEVALEGAGHLVFAGPCDRPRRVMRPRALGFCADPGWETVRAHEVIGHHVAAFLLAELTGDPDATAVLGSGPAGLVDVAYRSEGY